MEYMLLIHSNEAATRALSQEDIGRMVAAYGAYTEAVKQAGIMVSSNRLRPSSAATTVRVADGRTQVLDGPFAESKEQLAGYYLIDVADLDAAMSWAGRCPTAQHGIVEVRAIWAM